jgi:branched-chain amino acid transport system permease protein
MIDRTTLRQWLLTPAILILLLSVISGLVLLTGRSVYERLTISMLISVVLVVGLAIFTSNSGVISFGHVSFMAIGAYTCAYLTIPVQIKQGTFSNMPDALSFLIDVQAPFLVAVVIAGLVAALLALGMVLALAWLGGPRAGPATLGLLVIVQTVLFNWNDVTRGASSMIGIPLTTNVPIALGFASVAIIIAWAFSQSRMGMMLQATRDDELAARSVGIRIAHMRGVAWVLSAFVAGMSGALFSHFITTFTPRSFYLVATFSAIVMLVVGGFGGLSGAVVGVVAISVVQEVLRRFQTGGFTGGADLPAGIAEVVLAGLLLLVLIKRPQGILGTYELGFTKTDAHAPVAENAGTAS